MNAAVIAALVPLVLVAAIGGGLARAGAPLGDTALAGQAMLHHGALVICGVLGTLVSLERAVALRVRAAWLVPAASAGAAFALLAGAQWLAALLLVGAGLLFLAVHGLLWQRQQAPHVAMLAFAAALWACGNLLYLWHGPAPGTLAFWFGFLAATIAAERLEMTRLARRARGATGSLAVISAGLLAGAAASVVFPAGGGIAYGAALASLAAWLLRHDVARRTWRAPGLPRYMALCLLAGYAWLAAGGAAWAAWSAGAPLRDFALHALGLGFILSMVFAHAPVILPAIARVRLAFGPVFYLPLAVLHAGLAWRLLAGPLDMGARLHGALANGLAVLLFALVAAGSALRYRLRAKG